MNVLEFQKLIRKNKNEAFSLLVELYSQKVFGYVLHSIGKKEDAEDLVQEIFEGAFSGLTFFKGNARPQTWIISIAKNKIAEYWRKNNAQKRKGNTVELNESFLLKSNFIESKNPESEIINQEDLKILLDSINELPENQRRILTLNKIDGFSYKEIAEMENLSLSSVESLIFRARKKLKEILKSKIN